jgi:hypothetical protein
VLNDTIRQISITKYAINHSGLSSERFIVTIYNFGVFL